MPWPSMMQTEIYGNGSICRVLGLASIFRGSKSREKIDKEYIEVPHLLKEVKKTKHI